MPAITTNAKRLKSNAKNLFRVACLVLLVMFLSACSAIGFPKPAALQVTSTPEASVFLDGKHIGKTPFYSEQLKQGEYTLKVTESTASYQDKITLRAGALTVVNRELATNFLAQSGENLSLLSGLKGLFIVSLPTDADIAIDGRYIGKTPYLVEDLEDGDHKVLLNKEGFVQREFAIKTSSRYQLLADVTLASQIAKGVGIVPKEPEKPKSEHIQILSTPQGFLRVRKEPSLSAAEVGQVKPQEEYEIIQEIKDWYQISFEGKLGWISSTYTKKVE